MWDWFFLYFPFKFCKGSWEIGAQPIRLDPLANAKRLTAVFFPSYLVVSGGSQLTLKLHNILQQSGPPTLLKEKKMRKEMQCLIKSKHHFANYTVNLIHWSPERSEVISKQTLKNFCHNFWDKKEAAVCYFMIRFSVLMKCTQTGFICKASVGSCSLHVVSIKRLKIIKLARSSFFFSEINLFSTKGPMRTYVNKRY